MPNDEWGTPRDLFGKLNSEWEFDIDVACNSGNNLCDIGIDVGVDNALERDWHDYVTFDDRIVKCWMNPGYSRGVIEKFAEKAFTESQKGACIVVGLVKHDHTTRWFKEWIWGKAYEVRLCSRRVKYVDPATGKSKKHPFFPSDIVVWKPGIPEETKFSMFDW